MALQPQTAHRIDDTLPGGGPTDVDIPVEQVRTADLLRVRAGETVPVDGVVIEGASSVDESMITLDLSK